MEVDFVIGDSLAIEVKSKERIAEGELRPIHALAEEFPRMRRIVASGEKWRRITHDGIEIIPIGEFLQEGKLLLECEARADPHRFFHEPDSKSYHNRKESNLVPFGLSRRQASAFFANRRDFLRSFSRGKLSLSK